MRIPFRVEGPPLLLLLLMSRRLCGNPEGRAASFAEDGRTLLANFGQCRAHRPFCLKSH